MTEGHEYKLTFHNFMKVKITVTPLRGLCIMLVLPTAEGDFISFHIYI